MSEPKTTVIYAPNAVYFEPDEGYKYCKLGYTRDRRVNVLIEPGDQVAYAQYQMWGAAGVGAWTDLPSAIEDGLYVIPVTLPRLATLGTEIVGPWTLTDGETLTIAAFNSSGAYAEETITLATADFADISAATAAELAAVIADQAANVTATEVDDALRLRAVNAADGDSFLTVTENDTAEALGLGYGNGTTVHSEWRQDKGDRAYRGLSADEKTIFVRFRDAAEGTPSAVLSDWVVLDTMAPVLPMDLRNLFGFGLPLVRGDGIPFPEDHLYDLCLTAMDKMEEWLHVYLTPTRIVSAIEHRDDDNLRRRYDYDVSEAAYDFRNRDAHQWWFMELRNYPIIGIPSMKLVFLTNAEVMDFPSEWIKVYPKTGQLHVTPGGAGLANFAISAGGRYMPVGVNHYSRLPQYIRIDYTVGWERGQLPADVWEATCKLAAISLFNMAGDAVEFGTSSRSLSDGVISQSWSSTAGVENALLGARIIQYKKELVDFEKRARTRYRRPNLVVV